ncbi:hypothetical protein RGQ15_11590 [Paracoccus sp. MBLB3053]|uniref:DUF3168 domain-containing protein n=1 Tax=Paracoccus aurantius TaxID=3073814 RepID=A0ABU2HT33_9RHOB|nr:hypothetical protein [Paracoccus sp. MBLB3053]MDS9468209.1 hypothetical protein [Paracoccus sp. MBLB3053]
MPHYRSAYRAAIRAALRDNARFADFTIFRVWPGSIDAETLPVIGVLTPQDRCQKDSHASTERGTLLQVAVRRAGHDEVEDDLDDDSETIEAVVLAAMRDLQMACNLEETTVVSNTDARSNIGTLVMNFRVRSWRPPATIS